MIYRLNAFPIKISTGFFAEIDELIWKFLGKFKEPRLKQSWKKGPSVIRKTQIKTIRYNFTATRTYIELKGQTVTSIDNDVEKSEPSHTTVGNVKWCIYFEE